MASSRVPKSTVIFTMCYGIHSHTCEWMPAWAPLQLFQTGFPGPTVPREVLGVSGTGPCRSIREKIDRVHGAGQLCSSDSGRAAQHHATKQWGHVQWGYDCRASPARSPAAVPPLSHHFCPLMTRGCHFYGRSATVECDASAGQGTQPLPSCSSGCPAQPICARRTHICYIYCLLYTSPSPRDLSTSRMPSSA